MKNLILKIVAPILLCCFCIGYAIAFHLDNFENKEAKPYFHVHQYETSEQPFYNGEILLPDYIHTDTLIVTDAKFLNDQIIDDKYEVASDGDISDLLAVGTMQFCSYTNTAKK